MIDEQIALAKTQGAPHKNAYIGIKINSLTDKVIIDKLVEASCAGVRIELCVRGICCLVPGIRGLTDNIKIVSIVGRFLEHSRIYIFGNPSAQDGSAGVSRDCRIFIGSADFMTRNTERRVEVAVPVFDDDIKNRLVHIFDYEQIDYEIVWDVATNALPELEPKLRAALATIPLPDDFTLPEF